MPSTDELPDDLAPLARRNAFELHDSSWGDDVRRLISALDNVIGRKPVEESSSRDGAVESVGESARGTEPSADRIRWILLIAGIVTFIAAVLVLLGLL